MCTVALAASSPRSCPLSMPRHVRPFVVDLGRCRPASCVPGGDFSERLRNALVGLDVHAETSFRSAFKPRRVWERTVDSRQPRTSAVSRRLTFWPATGYLSSTRPGCGTPQGQAFGTRRRASPCQAGLAGLAPSATARENGEVFGREGVRFVATSPVGKTRDAGWQIGVSRSIAVDLETLWSYLVSTDGLATWLGRGVVSPLAKGQRYETEDGTTGEIRSLRDRDRLRLTWQPVDRPDHATVQVAVAPSKSGCSVRFHTERLHDADERERMREHWRTIIDRIEADLTD